MVSECWEVRKGALTDVVVNLAFREAECCPRIFGE
jgi:hypothetical protein